MASPQGSSDYLPPNVTVRERMVAAAEETWRSYMPDAEDSERRKSYLRRWAEYKGRPVDFVLDNIAPQNGIAPYQHGFLQSVETESHLAWVANRGAGKTASLAWLTIYWLLTRPFSRVLILAPTLQRQVSQFVLPEIEKWVETAPRPLPIDVKGTRADVEGFEKRWCATGSQATDPDKIEGLHADDVLVIVDEAKGVDQDVVDSLQGTQTSPRGSKAYIMTSAAGTDEGPFYECFHAMSDLWWTLRTDAYEGVEAGLIDPGWIEYCRTAWGEDDPRFRRQVLAEFAADVQNALWERDTLAANRVPITEKIDASHAHPKQKAVTQELAKLGLDLEQIVVAIDPSGSKGGDECGIVVVGKGRCTYCHRTNGDSPPPVHGFLLEDLSGQYAPERWARLAVDAYQRWHADKLVAEKNYGGDMVRRVLRAADVEGSEHVPVRLIHAKKGKSLRAQPVATLDGDGKVHHVGRYVDLENQMCGWDPEEDSRESPDRVDARTYGFTDLFNLDRAPKSEDRPPRGPRSHSSFAM